LDPKARLEFKNLIRLLAGQGKTIFISSHILSELGEMCDHLLFIDAGRIVHQGSTESLTEHTGVEVLVEIRVAGAPEALYNWISAAGDMEMAGRMKNGARVRMKNTHPRELVDILKRLVLDGVPVIGFFKVERRLEEAFVDMLRTQPPPMP
jgi:ABC-2 type transport system ATP-binding protein